MTGDGAELAVGGGTRQQRVALLGGLGFALLGVGVALAPGADLPGVVMGTGVAAFFGPVCLWALIRSCMSKPFWVFAQDGIRFPRGGRPTIPWSEVADTKILSAGGRRFLAIDVVDPEWVMSQRGALGGRLGRMNLRRGWGAVAISEGQSPCSLEDLKAAIDGYRASGARGEQ